MAISIETKKPTMKILIVFILTALIYSVSFAQKKNTEDPIYEENSTIEQTGELTTHNFLIDNNKLIWQKVFDTKLDFKSLVSQLKIAGVIENIEVSELRITGDLRQLPADFKGAGFTGANTPIIITRSDLLAYCVVEFKENKYRVTLKNLNLVQRFNDVLFKMGEKTNLEVMAIKGEIFRKPFLKTSSVIIDYSLSNAFRLNQDNNENW